MKFCNSYFFNYEYCLLTTFLILFFKITLLRINPFYKLIPTLLCCTAGPCPVTSVSLVITVRMETDKRVVFTSMLEGNMKPFMQNDFDTRRDSNFNKHHVSVNISFFKTLNVN